MTMPSSLRVFVGIFSGVALLVAIFGVVHRITPSATDIAWTHELYRTKEAAAATANGPRILFVGGSSMHFGVSARHVTELTQIPSYNLGVFAALGADYMLFRAKRLLRAGDVVVIAFEPGLLSSNWKPTDVLSAYVLRHDAGYFYRAPIGDSLSLLFAFTPWNALKSQVNRYIPRSSKLYDFQSVDPLHGDEQANKPENASEFNRRAVDATAPLAVGPAIYSGRMPVVKAFTEWAQTAGVKVVSLHVPGLMRPEYSSELYRNHFDSFSTAMAQAGAPMLVHPASVLVERSLVLDTAYHLTDEGAREIARRLAQPLIQVMQRR
jgi:hypothetical protein